MKELKNRYRRVETPKAYGAKFSHRSQHPGESVEDYTAELKKLYDKAHAGRDEKTRQEDLLRRFLDGLLDEQARFQVEFNKDPSNIDDAVYDVVNFLETTKRSRASDNGDKRNRRSVRLVRPYESDDEAESDEEQCDGDNHIRLARTKSNPSKANNSPHQPWIKNKTTGSGQTATQNNNESQVKVPKTPNIDIEPNGNALGFDVLQAELRQMRNSLEEGMGKLAVNIQGGPNVRNYGNQQKTRFPTRNQTQSCFRCGEPGHYAGDCKVALGGQVQFSGQPQMPVKVDGANSNRGCFRCGKPGHYARDCKVVLSNQEQTSTQPRMLQNRGGNTSQPMRQVLSMDVDAENTNCELDITADSNQQQENYCGLPLRA